MVRNRSICASASSPRESSRPWRIPSPSQVRTIVETGTSRLAPSPRPWPGPFRYLPPPRNSSNLPQTAEFESPKQRFISVSAPVPLPHRHNHLFQLTRHAFPGLTLPPSGPPCPGEITHAYPNISISASDGSSMTG